MYSGNTDGPYPMGVDPVWLGASNSIMFLNGYKMKISLIFGVIHMTFGVLVRCPENFFMVILFSQNLKSLGNKVSKRQWSGIFLEFLPQLIFLLFLFGYLISMIFIKWFLYGANFGQKGSDDMQWSEHCAPNLLITFIGYLQTILFSFGNPF